MGFAEPDHIIINQLPIPQDNNETYDQSGCGTCHDDNSDDLGKAREFVNSVGGLEQAYKLLDLLDMEQNGESDYEVIDRMADFVDDDVDYY